jgi:hypothetical protein
MKYEKTFDDLLHVATQLYAAMLGRFQPAAPPSDERMDMMRQVAIEQAICLHQEVRKEVADDC